MDRQLDRQIREALEGYQVPYDEQTWDHLEMRLKQAGLVSNANPVDDIAKQALADLDVPYNPSTWHILSEKLEQLDYNRKLITVKFIEAALILLAFLTVIRYTATPDPLPGQAGMASNTRPSQEQHIQDHQENINRSNSESQQIADLKTEVQEIRIARSDHPGLNIRSESRVVEPLAAVVSKLVLPAEQITRKQLPFTGLNDIDAQSASPLIASYVGLEPLPKEFSSLDASKDLVTSQADYMTYTLPALSWPGERKLQTKVGIYAQGNMHRVFTPEPFSHNRIVETVALSSSVGFVTAVHIGNAGFDFGFVYEKLSFQGVGDDNFIYKASLPVHLKFIPLSVESINMYVKGGGSLHGVLHALYEEPIFASAPGQFSARDKFNDGLLHEGLADNNVYVTANVGIGLEKVIYRDIYFFGEALYQRQILGEGIGGATRNTFRTISLNLGINYTIR